LEAWIIIPTKLAVVIRSIQCNKALIIIRRLGQNPLLK
jgi:hypothetical protein